MTIAQRLQQIQSRIRTVAVQSSRNPETVKLVAVSKTRSVAEIVECFQAGHVCFGENYVQELVAKAGEVTAPVDWHFIGHLQSNKVKQIAGIVSMIHSVDRLSLAEEISRQWGRIGKECDILVQVNIAGEATKSGTTENGALHLVKALSQLPNIHVVGLMTMPPFFDDPDAARPFFNELQRLAKIIIAENIPGVGMKELSMGMSGDFEVAIEEGATLVRIGTSIFGER